MIVCGMVTVVAFLVWINNVSVAAQWYSDVMHNRGIAKAGNNNGAEIKEKLIDIGEREYVGPITGPITWLDGPASVDYSTMATLIPFFGMLYITIGLGRIAWKRNRERKRPGHFPFFRLYNGVMIVLGLIGTILGLII